MALTEVKRVLTHAATDPEFRTKFFSQPDFVLSKYDLTEEEKHCLKELDEERLADATKILDGKNNIHSNDIRI